MLPAAHAHPHYGPCHYPTGQSLLEQSTSLSFESDSGTYKIGDNVTIRSYLNVGVGSPSIHYPHTRIALETGEVDRYAVYDRHDNVQTAYYRYTVQPGDYSNDLDYRSADALHWGTPAGNLIDDDGSGTRTNCWLAPPGAARFFMSTTWRNLPALSVNANITIDGIVPRVENIATRSGAYGAGSPLLVNVTFSEPVVVRGPPLPTLELALDGGSVTATYLRGNESSSLAFNYTVQEGDLADGLGYVGAGALAIGGNGKLTDVAGNDAVLELPEPGEPGSLGATSNVSITAAPGLVTGVSTPLSDGTYPEGYAITVTVNFDEPVVFSGADPPPSLVLDVGGANRTASYASGNDTRSLAFHYAVQQGDMDADGLDYAGTGALKAGGAGLRDRAGDGVGSALPQPGGPGSLGYQRSIEIDGSAEAYVVGVDSPGGDSAYMPGDTVVVAVRFSVPVAVAGDPVLALDTVPPRNATYAGGGGGGGARTLEFEYEVEPNDAAADLDYAGTGALSLAGGSEIRRGGQGGGGAALLALPLPGGPGSLGGSRDILVDGTPPSAVRASSPSPGGAYGTGRVVEFAVEFDEPVVAEGAPTLALATEPPRSATYAGGSGTAELAFRYAVEPGDGAPSGLAYAGEDALSAGAGGAIRDRAGNDANPMLPPPPAASRGIAVHGGPLPVLAPASSLPDGGALLLDEAFAAAAFDINGSAFAIVASRGSGDEGVQLMRVHADGTLEAAGSLGDTSTLSLDEATSVDAFAVGNRAYAIATTSSDGVQLMEVHGDSGTLSAVGRVPSGASNFEISGAYDVDAFTLDNRTYAVVASHGSKAVQLIRVHVNNGTLEAADSLAKSGDASLLLDGARGVDVFETAGGRTYAIVASVDDHGVQLVRVHGNNGTLEAAGSLADNGTLRLQHPAAVDAFDMGNRTYAVVASLTDDGVQLVQVHGDTGTLEAAGSLADDIALKLGNPISVDAFDMGNRTYAVVASKGDGGVQLIRVHENGTLEAAGSIGDDDDLELDGASGVDAFAVGNRTYAVVASEVDDGVQLIRLSPASVAHISSTLQEGPVRTRGYEFNVTVGFDERVALSGPPPSLMLSFDGGATRAAEYLSGNNTRSLVFNYTVQLGDSTVEAGRLPYVGPAALAARGAVYDVLARGAAAAYLPAGHHPPGDTIVQEYVRPRGSAAADLELPAPGGPDSPGYLQRSIAVDAAPPRVLSVSSGDAAAAGPLVKDALVRINVTFGEPVVLSSDAGLSLRLAFDGGATGTAAYERQSGDGRTLVFNYTVQPDDSAARLDYDGTDALVLDGGTAKDVAGNDAVLDLPDPGPASLASAGIAVDAAPPRVLSVSSGDAAAGPRTEDDLIRINATFGEPVVLSNADLSLRLAFDGGATGTAEYERQSGDGRTLVFNYTVQPDDSAALLDYDGTDALVLDGGTVRDAAGNDAVLDLPDPGPISLASAGIAVDAIAPRVLSVSSGDAAAAGPLVKDALVRINVTFGEPVVLSSNANLSLRLAFDGGATGTAEYERQSGDGRTLVFNYTVQPDDSAALLDYDGTDALTLAGGTITDAAGNDAVLNLPDPGPASLASAGIAVDAAPPRVLSVSSPDANGTHGVGAKIDIAVEFDEAVFVTGSPRMWLDAGTADREASYVPGGDPRTLVFEYTVLPGDATPLLEYNGTRALVLNGGTIKDNAGNDAVLRLPDPGRPASLGGSSAIAINTTAPARPGDPARVLQVLSTDSGGSYGAGSAINITVAFSRAVNVTGAPTLALSTDPARSAAYVEGTDGDAELGFRYAVRPGDGAARLDYAGTDALVLNGGTIRDGDGNNAVLRLPGPGPNSLASAGIAIDTAPPRVLSVSSPDANGTHGVGAKIDIAVEFDEAVYVTGSPRMWLDAGTADRDAAYASGGASRTLVFEYTVLPGDAAPLLEYNGTRALVLNGGTIRDAAGNDAVLRLPDPGSNSLGSSAIAINTTAPARPGEPARVLLVFSTDSGGSYGAGSAINITVAFSRAVNVTGAPTLALSTDPARSAAYVEGTDGDAELGFRYAVRPGDGAARLDYAGTDALVLNGGTIRDGDGNDANLELPRTGSPRSLHASGIAIGAGGAGGSGSGQGGSGSGQGGSGSGQGPGNATGEVVVVVGPGGAVGRDGAVGAGNATRITLDIRGLAGGGAGGSGSGTVAFPTGGPVVVNASFASIAFPPGVEATSVPPGGLLVLHATNRTPSDQAMQAALGYDGSGRVKAQRIVEIGAENSTVVFSMPVRISLEGQAGGRAFYIDAENGSIYPIDRACAADDTERVHRQLGGAGECQLDTDGGDKIIHTYHLTRFGTVRAETGAPPPTLYTCSMRLGTAELSADAVPGGNSTAARQTVVNSGSEPFERVGLAATPWYIDPTSDRPGPDAPSLPASVTTMNSTALGGAFAPLAEDGTADAARGLGGGLEEQLWFKLDLTAYDQVNGTQLVQRVAYTAACGAPAGR